MAVLIDMLRLVKKHFAGCEQSVLADAITKLATRECDECYAILKPLVTQCDHAALVSYSCEGDLIKGTSHPRFEKQYAGWR